MKIPGEEETALKQWLTQTLEPICDAEPDVLADYTLALIKHPGTLDELRTTCSEQLADFINGDPTQFVETLFRALQSKEYLLLPKQGSGVGHGTGVGGTSVAVGAKRSHPDAVMSVEEGGDDDTGFQPSLFQGLQQDDGDDDDDDDKSFGAQGSSKVRRLPDRAFTSPQRGGRGRGAGRATGGGGARKQPCRDFHLRGYCPRGDSCFADHSLESAQFLPPSQQTLLQQQQQQQQAMMAQMLQMQQMFPSGMPLDMAMEGPTGTMGVRGGRRTPSNRTGGGGGGGHRDHLAGGTIARSGPPTPSLAVEHVPHEHLNEPSIRRHFEAFGPIDRVELEPTAVAGAGAGNEAKSGGKAIVHFAQVQDARKAHDSPNVIFGNRFVKVYWWRPGQEGSHGNHASRRTREERQQDPLAIKATEELKRRQDAANKLLEVKRQKEALLSKLEEHYSMLQVLLKSETTPEAERVEMRARGEKLRGEIDEMKDDLRPKVRVKAMVQDEEEDPALKARLEELRAQAIAMGMDPDAAVAAMDTSSQSSSSGGYSRGQAHRAYSYRGRAGGRGRGSRGGFGAAATAAGPTSYRLDNRSKRLGVSAIPSGSEEQVKKYFNYVGGLETMVSSKSGSGFVATFKTRQAAEQALSRGSTIPDVGPVKLSWITDDGGVNGERDVNGGEGGEGEGPSSSVVASEDAREADSDRSWKR